MPPPADHDTPRDGDRTPDAHRVEPPAHDGTLFSLTPADVTPATTPPTTPAPEAIMPPSDAQTLFALDTGEAGTGDVGETRPGTRPIAGPAGTSVVERLRDNGFDSRYDIRDEVGRGGMGRVARAFDHRTRREVALKQLLKADAVEARARFLEECQITAQLEHPGIVPVHDLGIDESGRMYLSMKLVRGRSMKERVDEARAAIDDGKPLESAWPLTRRLEAFRKVCDAIAFAHSRGVIHRDIKPDNVMLGDFGEVLVMDWGLARIVGTPETHHDRLVLSDRHDNATARTLDGAVAGTPAYMSPEQARGDIEQLDERTDVYALGAILYELLTLTAPFRGPTSWDIISDVRLGRIEPADVRVRSEFGDGVTRPPRELQAVIERAMAFREDDRYRTVSALAADIDAFIAGRAVGAAAYSPWQLALKWADRNRGPVITGGIAALILAAAALAFVINLDNARSQAVQERDNADMQRREAVAAKDAEAAATRALDAQKTKAEHDAAMAIAEAHYLKATIAASNSDPQLALAYALRSLRVRPDPETIALASDMRVRARECIWCSPRGDIANPDLPGLTGSIERVVFSPDGERIAALSVTGWCGVFDRDTGEQLARWRTDRFESGQVLDIALTDSGALRVLHMNDERLHLQLVEFPGERIVWQFDSEEDQAICDGDLTPDGRFALYGTSLMLVYRVAGDGTRDTPFNATTDGPPLVWSEINAVAISDDGEKMAAIAKPLTLERDGAYMRIVNRARRAAPPPFRVGDDDATHVEFNRTGTQLVVTGVDHTIRVFDAVVGRAIREWHHVRSTWSPAQFVGSGDQLVFGDGSAARIASCASSNEVGVISHARRSGKQIKLTVGTCVGASRDGRWIASGHMDGTIHLHRASAGKVVEQCAGTLTASMRIDITADGCVAFGGGGEPRVQLRDWTSGAPLMSLPHGGGVEMVRFSPDGQQLGTVADDGLLRIWDRHTGDLLNEIYVVRQFPYDPIAPDGQLLCFAFSPDGRSAAVGAYNGQVYVVSLATGYVDQVFTRHGDSINGVEWLPDGSAIISSSYTDHRIMMWSPEDGHLLWETRVDAPDRMCLSPDGTWLAVDHCLLRTSDGARTDFARSDDAMGTFSL
ncbi:MAG: WD40 repeat domain-containing serine/threonine protein kinase, partial [Planctomycetota bacterium]